MARGCQGLVCSSEIKLSKVAIALLHDTYRVPTRSAPLGNLRLNNNPHLADEPTEWVPLKFWILMLLDQVSLICELCTVTWIM